MQRSHLGVYGIIKKNNCFLLIKKAQGPYTGMLDLPGGSIEFGETPEQTLIREIDEETGQKVHSYKLISVDSICFKHNVTADNSEVELHHIGIFYSVSILPNIDLKITPDGLDSDGAIWFNSLLDNINKLSPFAKKAIIEFRNE